MTSGAVRSAELVNTQTLDLTGIAQVQITYSSENLTFYESDNQQLVLKEYMNTDNVDYFARIGQDAGRLTIEAGQRLPNFNYRGYIEVYLPSGYNNNLQATCSSGTINLSLNNTLQDLYLSTSSGNINLAGVTTRITDCQASSGRIQIERLTASDGLMLSASSGSISVEDASTAQLWAQTSSGNLNMERVSAQTFGLSSSSGNQTLTDCRGAGSFETSSGRQILRFTEVSGSINAQASSGGITLNIPREHGFQFQAVCSSGRIRTDFDDSLFFEDKNLANGTVGEAGQWRIDLKTTSGNINVNYN